MYTALSLSSSLQGTTLSKSRRKDGDDQLDDDDYERILSRTTARRLLALFEGNSPVRSQRHKQASTVMVVSRPHRRMRHPCKSLCIWAYSSMSPKLPLLVGNRHPHLIQDSLFQRISIMLQRFNSVLLHDTLPVDLPDL